MRRDGAAHERLIPMLTEILGSRVYLEIGTFQNAVISRVPCPVRYGIDLNPYPLEGAALFKMDSETFVLEKAASLGPFDFVFIDGDHRSERALADFHGIWPYVSVDGVVALHDTNPETLADCADDLCSNSWRVAMSLKLDGYESVTLPFHPGLTLVRKRSTWEPKS